MEKKNYLEEELYSLVKKSSDILEFIESGSLDGIWYWDLLQPEYEWMSPRFWQVLGFDPKSKKHLVSEWQDLIFEEDLKVALENFNKHCADPNHPYDQIVRYRHKNGSTVWVRCRGIAIRDDEGNAVRMLGAHTDITELKELQFKLEEKNRKLLKHQEEIMELNDRLTTMASQDRLTGLYNRYLIDELMSYEKKKAIRSLKPFSICMIDINKFKRINDTYGHLAGDRVLIDFATKLTHMLRKQDIKSRWGGDEFLLLLPETELKDVGIVLDTILSGMDQWEVEFEGQIISYSVSIGVAEYSIGEKVFDCINRADKNLYEKKLEYAKLNK